MRKVITEMMAATQLVQQPFIFKLSYMFMEIMLVYMLMLLWQGNWLPQRISMLLTSGARFWMCSMSAGTLSMWIRNIVINFSENPADNRGRRARVNTAEIETCFDGIFAFPSPRRSRDCNVQIQRSVQILRMSRSLHSTCRVFQYMALSLHWLKRRG